MEQNNSLELGLGEATGASPARERWRAIVAEQRASGLSVSAFCRGKSIPPSSFYGWRQKLEGRPRQSSLATRAQGPAFVPVKLGAGAKHAPAASGAGSRPIELRLRGGRRMLVRRGFDRQVLIEAVRVLEDLA